MGIMHLYFNPSGRINRSTFWLQGVLLLYVIWIVIWGALMIALVNTAGGIDPYDFVRLGLHAAQYPQDILYVIEAAQHEFGPFVLLIILSWPIFLWSNFAVAVKRLHDRDKSAWWMLLWWAISAIGGIFTFGIASLAVGVWMLIELGVLEGTLGRNRYGESPQPNQSMAHHLGYQPGYGQQPPRYGSQQPPGYAPRQAGAPPRPPGQVRAQPSAPRPVSPPQSPGRMNPQPPSRPPTNTGQVGAPPPAPRSDTPREPVDPTKMTICPHCAEIVAREDAKCVYCGSDITPEAGT